jgi:hypothetical protein
MRVTANSIKLSKVELTILGRAEEILGTIADVTDEMRTDTISDDAIYTKSAHAEYIISDLIALVADLDFHQL